MKHAKLMPTAPQHAGTDGVHATVHIAICPNQQLHLRIGSACLHLCRKDFVQLAKAVMETMTTLEADERKAILGEVH